MKNNLSTMRHSAAHLMAAAVKNLFPKTTLGIGPTIENGFYYDFDSSHRFSEEDFQKIEAEITRLKKGRLVFEKIEKGIDEAAKFVEQAGEPYKKKLISDLKKRGEKRVSFYKTGEFIDLCTGPHVKNSGEIGEVKLLSVAGAYWRGDEKNKMLQRLYGTAWKNKEDLKKYLSNIEEAKKRDHKKIGRELDLFTFLPIAPGMPFWYPKGLVIVNKLKEFIRRVNTSNGFEEISTPLLAKKEVWDTSGHWKLFKDDMFVFDIDKQTYALKPMNCPETLILYNTRQHSYKDLPLKWSDLDVLHRHEDSGTLNGLFRVRELVQDDGHIICTPETAETNIRGVLEMARKVFKVFGLSPRFYLSTKPEKALGDTSLWDEAQKKLESALKKEKINFEIKSKEGSFYGPKIDLHIEDSLGRNWQLSTLQLDVQMPKSFGATYIDKDGKEKTPVMIHKALLGSVERFVGILLEHFGGSLPTWLSPVQIIVLPITDRNEQYGDMIAQKLKKNDFRVEVDRSSETLQSKIRNAQLQKIPYMIIVGDKEQVRKKVAVRSREKGNEGTFEIKEFINRVKLESDVIIN